MFHVSPLFVWQVPFVLMFYGRRIRGRSKLSMELQKLQEKQHLEQNQRDVAPQPSMMKDKAQMIKPEQP